MSERSSLDERTLAKSARDARVHLDRFPRTRVLHADVGRYTLAFAVTDERDNYGFAGSQGYSLRVTFIRNPRPS